MEKAIKNIESYKISNINVSRTAAIIRLKVVLHDSTFRATFRATALR